MLSCLLDRFVIISHDDLLSLQLGLTT